MAYGSNHRNLNLTMISEDHKTTKRLPFSVYVLRFKQTILQFSLAGAFSKTFHLLNMKQLLCFY